MEIKYLKPAKDKLNSLNNKIEEKLRNEINELKDNPTSHDKVKLIRIDDRELFRLKIGERNKKLDHRAIFDIKNGKIVILAIIHRDEGYNVLK